MSYRLRRGESLSDGIQRIAREQVVLAIEDLTPPFRDREESVHDTRKRMKKIRAVLRLVRDEIGEEIYARENLRCRDIGRRLSVARDMTAMIEALNAMVQRGEERERDVTAKLLGELRRMRSDAPDVSEDEERLLADVREELRTALGRIARWPIERNDFRALRGGLRLVYRNGRRWYGEVVQDASVENLHEWRKQVKYLWYHIRILRPLWPKVLGGMARELRDLSEALGDDHDLASIRAMLVEDSAFAGDSLASDFIPLLDRRRAVLQQSAMALGARIYSEKPGAFITRIGRYWKVWVSGRAELPSDEAPPAAESRESATDEVPEMRPVD